MKNKYEIATGLFVGSEIGDIDREISTLVKKLVNSKLSSKEKSKFRQLQHKRRELLSPRKFKKKGN